MHSDAAGIPSLSELRPMLLTEAKQPWAAPDHGVELKHDGLRARVEIAGDQVEIRTRGRNDPSGTGVDATRWFPELVAGLAGLTNKRTVLDGEVVVQDAYGRADFVKVMERSRKRRWYPGAPAVVLAAFDVLIHKGTDVRHRSFVDRKVLLARLLATQRPSVMLVTHMNGELAPQLFEHARALELEGIVLKRLDSPYLCGVRSDAWIRVKVPSATPASGFTRKPRTPIDLGG